MITEVEIFIHKQLQAGKSIAEVGALLVNAFSHAEQTLEHRMAIANYFLQSQQTSNLIKILSNWVREKKTIPWGHLIEALSQSKITLTSDIIDMVLLLAHDQGLLQTLSLSDAVDQRFSQILRLRQNFQQQRSSYFENKVQDLLHKATLLHSEGLHAEEEKELITAQALAPAHSDVRLAWLTFKEQWAVSIIKNAKPSVYQQKKRLLKQTTDQSNHELMQLLFEACQAHAHKNPAAAHDLSLLFYFLNEYQLALKMIDLAHFDFSKEWYRLELMIETGNYLEAIAESQRLEMKYAQDPESAFASTYIRALALKGLEQNSKAIELLQGIVSIRPNYRAAHSLLLEWQGGYV